MPLARAAPPDRKVQSELEGSSCPGRNLQEACQNDHRVGMLRDAPDRKAQRVKKCASVRETETWIICHQCFPVRPREWKAHRNTKEADKRGCEEEG